VPYLSDAIHRTEDYDKAVNIPNQAARKSGYIIYELGTACSGWKVKSDERVPEEGGCTAEEPGAVWRLFLKDGNRKAALTEFKKTSELAPGSDLAQKAKDYIQTLR
jgi:hypothetical protein